MRISFVWGSDKIVRNPRGVNLEFCYFLFDSRDSQGPKDFTMSIIQRRRDSYASRTPRCQGLHQNNPSYRIPGGRLLK